MNEESKFQLGTFDTLINFKKHIIRVGNINTQKDVIMRMRTTELAKIYNVRKFVIHSFRTNNLLLFY